jgi:hypothetical protein
MKYKSGVTACPLLLHPAPSVLDGVSWPVQFSHTVSPALPLYNIILKIKKK